MKKKKTKFYASPFIMFGLLFLIVIDIGIIMFTLFYPFVEGRAVDDIVGFIKEMGWFATTILIIFVIVMPILAFILNCHKGFSVLEISDTGVKVSLFKIFRKTQIEWEEMYEIRCVGMLNKWIFFSKNICLEKMPYNDIIKRKDVMQVQYSPKMVEIIRSYTSKEIINLPESL